jgi:CheY-like chemotaxis protein/predicted transcriptional regulator
MNISLHRDNRGRMPNRSRIDIVAQILETVNDHGEDGYGVTQTTIRYEVFLSSAQLKEYLIALTIHGLLSFDPATRRYNATEKGLRFLQVYCNIGNLLNEEDNNKSGYRVEEQVLTEIKMANIGSDNNNNNCNDKPLDRLLVVDDDPDILQVVKLGLLKKNRFLIDAFTSPEEALQSFKTNAKAYRLMLSDIRMPSLSGIQLAKKVKEINLNVKVILMSAFDVGDNELSEVFSSSKIDAFLQKPIGIDDLTKKVMGLL